jgi:deoxyribodipyrimidine photo-lyase
MKLAIHWFRRDLRVSDNTALHQAAARAERVLPVFILEDALRTGPDVGAARLEFLLQSVESLRKNLAVLGYPLILRAGKSEVEIPKLCAEVGAQAVFANKRHEPYAAARDGRIFRTLNAAGVGFELWKDAVVWEELEILTQSEKPYTVFTPYSKAWLARKVPAPWPRLKPNTAELPQIPSYSGPLTAAAFGHPATQSIFPAGEAAAQKTLADFIAKWLPGYATNRNIVDVAGTSQLSPHLRAGTIGIRAILAKLAAAQPKDDIFLKELIWREFYLQILSNFPHVMRGSFRKEYDALPWQNNETHFKAWCEGRTGYPIVDAAMRCLNATGWMHNRLRMIVAMFLTKDLLITWQWGERYFMQQLVDGDMAANNGGWQWSAGSGTDAAPYFRIFNPVTQGLKCDPDAKFIRQWIPELAKASTATAHEPWKSAVPPRDYAPRIVLHEEQRAKCLAMFEAIKRRPSGPA